MKNFKSFFTKLSALTLAVVALSTVATAADPDATLTLKTTAVAAGVGAEWGSGELKFGGKKIPFSANGISLIDAGVSTTNAIGDVYGLKKLEDFAGTYTAAKGELAVGAGVGGIAMQNEKGVTVKLTSTQQGLKLALGPEGLKIKLNS